MDASSRDARVDRSGFALPASLKQVAMQEIRRRVFARELRPGVRVDPEVLGRELGMSKIPVREALSALVGEGIIESVPRRGAFVASLSRRDIEDGYWMLARISGHAAARAAESVTDATLNELESLADAMERTRSSAEREDLAFRFHGLINRTAASPRISATLRMLGSPLPLGLYEAHPDLAADADTEHRLVLDALRSRSADDARDAMEQHFDHGARASIAVLEEQGFWSAERGA